MATKTLPATLYKTDGSTETLTPANGKDFKIDELQKAIGGYVQPIYFADKIMLVDEDGMMKGRSYNDAASLILGHTIVGPALVIAKGQLK